MVNGKKYAYTPAGKAAAAAAKKKSDPALAYTKSAQDKDRQAVKDEYGKKYDPTIKQTNVVIEANRFLGDAKKERAAKESNYQTRMAKKGAMADQNRWIGMGARANALAIAKKKNKGKTVDYGYTKVPAGSDFDKNQKKLYEEMERQEAARVAKLKG
jgi:hypothetical protein